jgi:hypothetical protein
MISASARYSWDIRKRPFGELRSSSSNRSFIDQSGISPST